MLIFDLDGTLIDSNGVWLEVDKTFLARHGLTYSQEYHDGVAHSILQNCAIFTKNHFKMAESCEDIIAEWMELAKDAYDNVPLKPYVREYLDCCLDEGRRMAVFTASVPEHCRAAIARHGLERYFERIIFAQELGADKKSAAIFRQAAELLGVCPRDCVFFDDSLAACKGAKAAGMTVVGIQDAYFHGSEADMRELCDQYISGFGDLL